MKCGRLSTKHHQQGPSAYRMCEQSNSRCQLVPQGVEGWAAVTKPTYMSCKSAFTFMLVSSMGSLSSHCKVGFTTACTFPSSAVPPTSCLSSLVSESSSTRLLLLSPRKEVRLLVAMSETPTFPGEHLRFWGLLVAMRITRQGMCCFLGKLQFLRQHRIQSLMSGRTCPSHGM